MLPDRMDAVVVGGDEVVAERPVGVHVDEARDDGAADGLGASAGRTAGADGRKLPAGGLEPAGSELGAGGGDGPVGRQDETGAGVGGYLPRGRAHRGGQRAEHGDTGSEAGADSHSPARLVSDVPHWQ